LLTSNNLNTPMSRIGHMGSGYGCRTSHRACLLTIMLGLGTICKKEELDTMCNQLVDFGIELPEHPSEGDVIWVRSRIDLS
jgi:hypothetical protein